MGNISYGIYMYHSLVIALLLTGLEALGMLEHAHQVNGVLYALAPLLTIVLSWLSYRYFETFFLRFKEKFAVVKSGGSKH